MSGLDLSMRFAEGHRAALCEGRPRRKRRSAFLAVVTVGRTDTALGAFYRRLSARIGKAKAVTATARKIAVLCSTTPCVTEYIGPGASFYETRYRRRVVANLHRRAKTFGFVIQPIEPASVGTVSLEIVLQSQFADLGVQSLDIGRRRCWSTAAACPENVRCAAFELRFPSRDLDPVNVELFRQLRKRPVPLDRRQCHLSIGSLRRHVRHRGRGPAQRLRGGSYDPSRHGRRQAVIRCLYAERRQNPNYFSPRGRAL